MKNKQLSRRQVNYLNILLKFNFQINYQLSVLIHFAKCQINLKISIT